MKVAIHQINYLQWLGFYNKLKQVDKYVVYDIADYVKNDVINRNKIRTKDGWIYLTIPIERKYYRKPLYKVLLPEDNRWKKKHLNAIELNYSKADYFNSYKDSFKKLYQKDFKTLQELNEDITNYLIKEFGIDVEIVRAKELKINKDLKGTDILIEILKNVMAREYITGTGSKIYLDESKFKEIKLTYQHYKHPVYKQQFTGFEPYMAAIDLLFNMGEKSKEII